MNAGAGAGGVTDREKLLGQEAGHFLAGQ